MITVISISRRRYLDFYKMYPSGAPGAGHTVWRRNWIRRRRFIISLKEIIPAEAINLTPPLRRPTMPSSKGLKGSDHGDGRGTVGNRSSMACSYLDLTARYSWSNAHTSRSLPTGSDAYLWSQRSHRPHRKRHRWDAGFWQSIQARLEARAAPYQRLWKWRLEAEGYRYVILEAC